MTGWWAVAVPLLSAVLGATAGGFVVHRLTMAREQLAARRGQRVDYLVSAFQRLIRTSNRTGGLSEAQRDDLESAIADVILLGEPEEVEAARRFMVQFAGTRTGDLDPLLQALRDSLRREIGLTPTGLPQPYSLRIVEGPGPGHTEP